MRIAPLVALLLVFCGAVPFAESQPRPEKSINTENNPYQIQQGTKQSPLFVEIYHPTKQKEETEKDIDERKDRKILNTLTLCLAVVGLLQFFVFAYQAICLRNTIKATEKAVEATKESVDALKASERPYIFIEVSHAFLPVNNDRQTVICNYTISNFGKTPSIITYSDLKIMLDGESDFSLSTDGQINAKKVLAAGEAIKPGRTKDLPIETQNGKLFCYGVVRYEDIFGAEHVTEFHHIYVSSIEGFCISANKERNRYT